MCVFLATMAPTMRVSPGRCGFVASSPRSLSVAPSPSFARVAGLSACPRQLSFAASLSVAPVRRFAAIARDADALHECVPLQTRRPSPKNMPVMHGGGSTWDTGCCGSSSSRDHDHGHDHGHSHEHSHGHENGHDHSHEHDSESNSQSQSFSLISWIIALRSVPSIAYTAAVLLFLSTVLPLPTAAANVLLGGALVLTGLPGLVESVVRVFSSYGAAVDADILMSAAAVAAVVSGAPVEGALLTVLYAVSHAVEHGVAARARRDLDTLRDLAPTVAVRVRSAAEGKVNGENDGAMNFATAQETVPVSKLVVDDWVLVRVGEVVPCDGTVMDGTAFVVVQHLTGEAKPRPVRVGEAVPAGARALDAAIVVRVDTLGAESTMARISRLVVSAQANRPRITRFFDRYSRMYTRVVLGMALAFAVLLPVVPGLGIGYLGKFGSLRRALGFVVASSPCALLIGAPVAYLASLSAAARRGILVKGGPRALDATADAKHIVFDKTGTLTTGELSFIDVVRIAEGEQHGGSTHHKADIVRVDRKTEREVVALAAELERGAVHPIADAILRKSTELAAKARGHGEKEKVGSILSAGSATAVSLHSLKTIPGHGVQAFVSGPSISTSVRTMSEDLVRLGRMSFVLPGEPALDALFDNVSDGGAMVVTALSRGDDVYLLRFMDQVRAEARESVGRLRREGIAVSLLTGDADGAARLVEKAVGGLDSVIANATPESKLERIGALHAMAETTVSSQGSTPLWSGRRLAADGGVVMVGDGVNDAPALAASTVGIACGLSSATAVDAADVVLVRKNLRDVSWYVRKANATQSIVKQNLILALALMFLALVPTLAGAVPLWVAVLLHEGGTVIVGLNGLRLLSDWLS